MENVYNQLIKILPKEKVYLNEPMNKHTTFKVGGKADIFVIANTEEEIKHVLEIAKNNNTKVFVLGNGSNLLVLDGGIRGIVLKIDIKTINVTDEYIEAGTGVLLSKLSYIATQNSLSGLEFASRYTWNFRWGNKDECRSIWE